MSHFACRGCLLVSGSFFHNNPSNFVHLGGGVVGCTGFHSSFRARATQTGLSLNIGLFLSSTSPLLFSLCIFSVCFLFSKNRGNTGYNGSKLDMFVFQIYLHGKLWFVPLLFSNFELLSSGFCPLFPQCVVFTHFPVLFKSSKLVLALPLLLLLMSFHICL